MMVLKHIRELWKLEERDFSSNYLYMELDKVEIGQDTYW